MTPEREDSIFIVHIPDQGDITIIGAIQTKLTDKSFFQQAKYIEYGADGIGVDKNGRINFAGYLFPHIPWSLPKLIDVAETLESFEEQVLDENLTYYPDFIPTV